MQFWKTFLHSLRLPQKQAVFALNRTGMDIVVLYLFLLLIIVCIPSFIDQVRNPNSFLSNMNLVFLLIYFFIFYYLPLTLVVFTLLSIIAYIATKLALIMKRKLKYSILWKMSALSTTIPFIVYTIIAFFHPLNQLFLLISIAFMCMLLLKIILIYPKRNL